MRHKRRKLNTEHIDINDFNYPLDEDRIARYPLEKRDESMLLVCHPGASIRHLRFKDIAGEIPAHSLIIYNNTKVIHARVEFQKPTGARIEIFCLSPVSPVDYQLIFSTTHKCTWTCMVGNLKKWKDEILVQEVVISSTPVILKAKLLGRDSKNAPLIEFTWNKEYTFSEVLEAVGKIPIPPYLNRDTEAIDATRYQTVYSKHNGSVAAPTAGLHFTQEVFKSLKKNAVHTAEVTLHVGAGTFQPVKAENALEHEMHGEQVIVTRQLLHRILKQEGRIIATGTTTLRTLESIFWLGVKAMRNEDLDFLPQWYWKNKPESLTLKSAIEALLRSMDREGRDFIIATTEIMIVPGYQFKVVDGIITNFHQPKSTLLLLISAFIGASWKTVYDYALKNNFRFLSYGDSSLLWRQ